jgi:hypothetical protein
MSKSIATLLIAGVFSLQALSQQIKDTIIDNKSPELFTVDEQKFFSFQEYSKVPLSLAELNNPIRVEDFEENNSYTGDMKQFLDKNMELIYNRPKTLIEKGIIRDQLLNIDFNKTQLSRLSTNFYLFSNSKKKSYNSLGAYTQFNKAIRFQPNNRFSADFGGYFSRQINYLAGNYNDIWGVTSEFRYDFTKKLQFKIWGEYILHSGENSFYGNPLFPGSKVRGSLIYRFNERSGAEFGIRYQYYEFKRSWNLEAFGKLFYEF